LPAGKVLIGRDISSDLFAGIFGVESDVIGGGAMTSLAIDVYYQRVCVECIDIFGIGGGAGAAGGRGDIGGVAFEAP